MEKKNKIYNRKSEGSYIPKDSRGAGKSLSPQDKKKHMKVGTRRSLSSQDKKKDVKIGTEKSLSPKDKKVGTEKSLSPKDKKVGTEKSLSSQDKKKDMKIGTGKPSSVQNKKVGTGKPLSQKDKKVGTGIPFSVQNKKIGTGKPLSQKDKKKDLKVEREKSLFSQNKKVGMGRSLSAKDKKKEMKIGSRNCLIKGNGKKRLSLRERSPKKFLFVSAKRAKKITLRAPSRIARKRKPSSRVRGHLSERLRLKFNIARRWPGILGPQAVNNKSKAKDYITLTPEVQSTLVREWSKVYTPMAPGSDIIPFQVGRNKTSKDIYLLRLLSNRGLKRKRRRSALSSWGDITPHHMGRNCRSEGIRKEVRAIPGSTIDLPADSLRGRSRRSEALWATSKIQEELGGNERDAMVKLSGGNYKLFLSKHKVINKIIKDNLKLLEISKFTHVVARRDIEPSSGRMSRRSQWASVNFWITTTWLAIGELFSQIKKVRKNRGMYLQVSGRLGRAKMARKKRFKKIWGVVNNASATTKGEFSSQQIHTKLGVIGLKVYSC